jgi:2-keto-4-pentenoate hydratase/2-oxohepta-3-ene-1,7-dioic acid hydratase in catechol pathway
MKLARFRHNGREGFGIVSEDGIETVSGDLFDLGKRTGAVLSLSEVSLMPPLYPKKIICVGFNYRAHMTEMPDIATKNPTLTLKSQNTVIGSGETIILPKKSKQVEHEAELGIVIGRSGYKIKKPEEHIFGYTIVNDVTARDLEREMTQWSASKSFPTFCPVGPHVDTDINPSDLRISCKVNDRIRQDSRTSLMIYGPGKVVEFVSQFMRLERGDLIATGTVPGVGLLADGDFVEITIEGIGVLRNHAKLE